MAEAGAYSAFLSCLESPADLREVRPHHSALGGLLDQGLLGSILRWLFEWWDARCSAGRHVQVAVRAGPGTYLGSISVHLPVSQVPARSFGIPLSSSPRDQARELPCQGSFADPSCWIHPASGGPLAGEGEKRESGQKVARHTYRR